jgi:hypothetical protein
MKLNPKNKAEIIREINEIEKKRALNIIGNVQFRQWLEAFREKHIVRRFLYPLYTRDGEYSRGTQRIEQFGDFILPEEKYGARFYEGPQGWIRNEYTVFWLYLPDDREVIYLREPHLILEEPKLYRIPAESIWEEISGITKELGLFGERGGGIYISDQEVNAKYLAESVKSNVQYTGVDGDVKSYNNPGKPRWMTLFEDYETWGSANLDIELRPAWFHITNYAFFNTPNLRLPVFYASFQSNVKLKTLQFLEGDWISHEGTDLISQTVLSIPTAIRELTENKAFKREYRNMVWWLWYNIGHENIEGTLSLGRIAQKEKVGSKSSVQRAINSFDKTLREKMDRQLLGRLLTTAISLGLGYGSVYRYLTEKKLIPHRNREIDDFDQYDELL